MPQGQRAAPEARSGNDFYTSLLDPLQKLLSFPWEPINYDSTGSEQERGCQNLKGIKSMEIPTQSCVRLFRSPNCQGDSLSLYPKPENSGVVSSNLPPVGLSSLGSVGPCLRNEFQFANITQDKGSCQVAFRKDESNIHHVPDLADFHGYDNYSSKSRSFWWMTNPVDNYYRDEQGRLRWIAARIGSWHLNNNNNNSGWGGVQGQVIPSGLGGPTNEAYNSFSQSQNNYKQWGQIMDQIWHYVTAKRQDNVDVYVTFEYENSSLAKPYGFYYWVGYSQIRWTYQRILYGFMEN